MNQVQTAGDGGLFFFGIDNKIRNNVGKTPFVRRRSAVYYNAKKEEKDV